VASWISFSDFFLDPHAKKTQLPREQLFAIAPTQIQTHGVLQTESRQQNNATARGTVLSPVVIALFAVACLRHAILAEVSAENLVKY